MFAGEWICKRVAYEQSDELVDRSDAGEDYERPSQPAAKTEFARATALLTEKRFEVRAPEIMSDPIATGTWKKKGRSLTVSTETLHYGEELYALRSREKQLEFVLRLNQVSYDTHDLLVLIFARGGTDHRALLDELANLEIWDQQQRLRDELDDDGAISQLLWSTFSQGEWPAEGASAALLTRFPSAATAEWVAKFFATTEPDPDCEPLDLLTVVSEGDEAPIAEGMGPQWLENFAQSRMLTRSDVRFFAEMRRPFFPQPAFDLACAEYSKRSDASNLEAIRTITADGSVDRIRAMVRYTGANRFDLLVEACDAVTKETAIAALTSELGSKVPHLLLNVAHALDALGAAPAQLSEKRAEAVKGITTYVLFGALTQRDFEIMQKLGVDTAALRIAVTAD